MAQVLPYPEESFQTMRNYNNSTARGIFTKSRADKYNDPSRYPNAQIYVNPQISGTPLRYYDVVRRGVPAQPVAILDTLIKRREAREDYNRRFGNIRW